MSRIGSLSRQRASAHLKQWSSAGPRGATKPATSAGGTAHPARDSGPSDARAASINVSYGSPTRGRFAAIFDARRHLLVAAVVLGMLAMSPARAIRAPHRLLRVDEPEVMAHPRLVVLIQCLCVEHVPCSGPLSCGPAAEASFVEIYALARALGVASSRTTRRGPPCRRRFDEPSWGRSPRPSGPRIACEDGLDLRPQVSLAASPGWR